ncbi:monovalent cation/H(+) antiporter subunit G [Mesobacillus jeotgali]|jgi:multicomponent Na+:H+ antiporter subunit G|uniref:Monovalent cation/H(+) antiporter subunit G n=1 Tax=Mesobacillus jeotgali TaxID=129985 RepID=A0ABY9VN16_9BACI|nr:monovalent cation/H(+) antiporter subunit G [Mesobacillus jeotgali]WNF22366.1 monovalent cation/H(+) antiporter subunit G [Mesobacillus jeotgali]
MTEMEIVKFFAGLFILIGAFLSLVTAFGLIRLPDVYTRNHAASKSATMGVMLVLLGTFIYFWFIEHHFNSRLLLGVLFIFLTSPVAGHLIARAAYNSGVKLSDRTVQDDLAKARKKMKAEEHLK